MNENVIEWLTRQDVATITLSQQKYITKIERMAKSHPNDVEITARNKDGSIVAHVPLSFIKISPKKKVEMSDERKEQLAETLRKAREKK